MSSGQSRISTLQVSDIVERESGADAKAKITKKIQAYNQKVIANLIESGIKSAPEEKPTNVKTKKTGTIKKGSVEVTTKIIKTP